MASLALAETVTSETYQLLSPVVPESVPLMDGGWVSTLPLALPMLEQSPHEESAQ